MDYFKLAIEAAVNAGDAIMGIYERGFNITYKKDSSPLTDADLASNEVINSVLTLTNIPIISEESEEIEYSIRRHWDLCWIVDPLDGTKEFIKRNGEFTVNIALCKEGKPVMGVIYVPFTKEVYYGDVLQMKAFKTVVINNEIGDLYNENKEIEPAPKTKSKIRVVASRSHMNPETKAFMTDLDKDYEEVEVVTKGSSLKFCLVAEGKADIYPRFAPTMEWDTAAGQAICEAVGLEVIDQATQKPMVYNRKNLLNSYFLVR